MPSETEVAAAVQAFLQNYLPATWNKGVNVNNAIGKKTITLSDTMRAVLEAAELVRRDELRYKEKYGIDPKLIQR